MNVSSEKLVPLSKIAPVFPGPPSMATILRWAAHGVRGHRLETVFVGNKRFTSKEAIQRFWNSLNPGFGEIDLEALNAEPMVA